MLRPVVQYARTCTTGRSSPADGSARRYDEPASAVRTRRNFLSHDSELSAVCVTLRKVKPALFVL